MPIPFRLGSIQSRTNRLLLRVGVPFGDVHVTVAGKIAQAVIARQTSNAEDACPASIPQIQTAPQGPASATGRFANGRLLFSSTLLIAVYAKVTATFNGDARRWTTSNPAASPASALVSGPTVRIASERASLGFLEQSRLRSPAPTRPILGLPRSSRATRVAGIPSYRKTRKCRRDPHGGCQRRRLV
jgi:hypothetical protein